MVFFSMQNRRHFRKGLNNGMGLALDDPAWGAF